MSFAQPRTMRTISAAASGVPSPQVSGFDSFEEPFGVLFNHAALGQLHEHVRQRNIFRGHGCGICCPGSGCLGPQSSGPNVAAVCSLTVQCGTIALGPGAYPLA